MNQNATKKHSILISTLLGALILSVCLSAFLYFKGQQIPHESSVTKIAEKQTYSRYCNAQFGFCISHPSNLSEDPPPDSGDGQIFRDSNGFVLTASGSYNPLDYTIETQFKSSIRDFDEITYNTKTDNWFVISGIKNGKIIYIKKFLGRGEINNLNIEYPIQAHSEYKKAVEIISNSFKPGNIN